MPQLIGTAPNQVPTNGDLGSAAYMDTSAFYGTGNSASFRNRIINGAITISQRGASPTQTGGGDYSVDRFFNYYSGNAYTSVQSTTAPAGFINSLLLTITTASASPTYSFFGHKIEGLNCADLGFGTSNASPVTLSFWVRSSVIGVYSLSLSNNEGNRAYAALYTINVANTWEYKTLTIPGDTSGTWLTTNGTGIFIRWNMGTAVGSARLISAGSWQAVNADGATGSTGANAWANTSGATFYITGVQLEKGTVATPFEHRPFGTELALCQRYFSKLSAASGNAYVAFGACVYTSAGSASGFVKYPTTMRSSPTISYGGSISFGRGVSLINITGVGTVYAGTDSALWQPSGLTGGSDGDAGVILASNDTTAFISFSSEL